MAADNCAQMAADDSREELNLISRRIIGGAQRVSSVLGTGFLEKVYENALCFELRRAGLGVEQQKPLEVRYEDQVVGSYVTDLLVSNRVLVELKAVWRLESIHQMQCIHYLRATGLRLGLLINFGRPRLEWQRMVNNF